jgi:hypothetical protein
MRGDDVRELSHNDTVLLREVLTGAAFTFAVRVI